MMQEAKILMADMLNMDPLARAWREMYREWIGKEVMAAQEAAAASTTMPSVAPPPVIDAHPPVVSATPDAMEVAPPLTPFLLSIWP
jgi:hypothetical protein